MKQLYTLLAALTICLSGFAQLDPSFGTGGVILRTYPSFSATGNDLTLLANDKFLFAGTKGDAIMIIRYNANGSIDNTFGTLGEFEYTEPGIEFRWTNTQLFSDGSILVSGGTYDGDYNTYILKLTANGTIDNSFGQSGITHFQYGDMDFAVTPSDKIFRTYAYFGDYILQRINPNGIPDSTFGLNSIVSINIAANSDPVIKVQPDEKILLAYKSDSAYVLRLNADGSVDNTFGNNGKTSIKTANVKSQDLLIQNDGRIVYIGDHNTFQPGIYTYIARFNSNGSYDNTFGAGTGYILDTIQGSNSYLQPRKGFLQADGKIAVGGAMKVGSSPYKMYAARYNTDGSIDGSFATGGKYVHNFFDLIAISEDVLVQSSGRVIIGGYSTSSTTFNDRFAALGVLPDNGIGIDEVEKTIMNIIPNPANEQLHIKFQLNTTETVSINIYDNMGRLIKCIKNNYPAGVNSEIVDLSEMIPGQYWVRYSNNMQSETSAFIKL